MKNPTASVNLRHLHAVIETARLGSVSQAARAVHLTQSAVSQALTSVERYFAATLFTRSPHGVVLTAAGTLCLPRIERALHQLRECAAELPNSTLSTRAFDLVRTVSVAQLDALIAVVEERNFSAAARARHCSQAVIHRAARTLERALSLPLFERTSFGVVPTRAAERLARRARLAFAELEQARAEVAALDGGEQGRTTIGALPLARAHLVPTTVIEFAARYPQHRVTIIEGAYEYLLSSLKNGAIDFLVGALRDPKLVSDVVQEHLFDDPLCIVVRVRHPLTQRRLTPAALLKFPWVAPRVGSPLRAHFEALFAVIGQWPQVSIECNSLAAARALLAESDHVMLLSAQQIHYERRMGLLTALPLPTPAMQRAIGVTYRQHWLPTRAQRELLTILRAKAHAPGLQDASDP